MKVSSILATLLVFFLSSSHIEAGLQVGYYCEKCPSAEAIIRDEVENAFKNDGGVAPGILRLHFHDCFIRGCDASLLIDSTPMNQAEKDGPPNKISLRGFEVIDNAKARLEATCKGTVSCADILSFAARDSVVLTGGPRWDVPAGRRDGRISKASETIAMPAPFFNLNQSTKSFADKGFSQVEMIALLGAHTIGRSHCAAFANRLYNFSSTTPQDPTLNPKFAEALKQQCPRNSQGEVSRTDVVDMNQTPLLMDNSYYRDLFKGKGLFTSDQRHLDSRESTQQVASYAVQQRVWQEDFVKAMIKMSLLQELAGNQGEIRANCRVINP